MRGRYREVATALCSSGQPRGRRAPGRATLGWPITGGKPISRPDCCSQGKGIASTVNVVPIK